MQKHHLLERRVSLKDSTKLGENYRPHNSTGKQQTCYVSLKKKKDRKMFQSMVSRGPRSEFKARENYLLILRLNASPANICLTGCQSFYELVSSFVFSMFPFWTRMPITIIPILYLSQYYVVCLLRTVRQDAYLFTCTDPQIWKSWTWGPVLKEL